MKYETIVLFDPTRYGTMDDAIMLIRRTPDGQKVRYVIREMYSILPFVRVPGKSFWRSISGVNDNVL